MDPKSCALIADVEDRLGLGGKRMDDFELMLKANTKDTAEVLDILRLAKSFFRLANLFGKVFKWGGGIALTVLGLYYAIKGDRS